MVIHFMGEDRVDVCSTTSPSLCVNYTLNGDGEAVIDPDIIFSVAGVYRVLHFEMFGLTILTDSGKSHICDCFVKVIFYIDPMRFARKVLS